MVTTGANPLKNTFLEEILSSLGEVCERINISKGGVITQQFATSDYFYLLIDGGVKFYINIEEGNQELFVGESNSQLTPIGWSGFRPPGRYATTVKSATDNTIVLRWKHEELKKRFFKHPQIGVHFFQLILPQARDLIKQIVSLLNKYNPNLIEHEMLEERRGTIEQSEKATKQEARALLRKSPFFEVFNEDVIQKIIPLMKKKKFHPGETIFVQDEKSDGLFFLGSGKVLFNFKNDSLPSSPTVTAFRSISSSGYIISWSGCVNRPNIVTAEAVYESTVFYIEQKDLDGLLSKELDFQLTFSYRLLWLIGNQLRALRARLISAEYDKEIIAIKNLLEQNSTQLSVLSELHKVPYLLDNKITLEDGLEILEIIKSSGTTLEKSLATLSLDILGQIKKEHYFFHGLLEVYNDVVSKPEGYNPLQLRKESSKKFINVFEKVPQIVTGKELLPKNPGHIFIYNHLRNDPYNTLPNNFQLTLDSHYISSVILFNQYHDPGIRVVRIGKGPEYGHQYYYNRLGHINVLTKESDSLANIPEEKERVRQQFYKEAGEHLKNGTNLIISPEGTSYGTDESPGAFKSGAFRLALSLEEEPLIIPIVVANFDKRIRYNTLSVMIKEPFKVSDYIKDATSKEEMKAFLKDLEAKYKRYVGEAVGLAARATHNQNRLE